jgi:patatin-related protein
MAVVIYGGASLAVYMHGVTKELLNLVRASKVLHELGSTRAAGIAFAEGPDRRKADTDEIYFEILKSINREQDFRVVIDAIAGASAGAINGVMLAKALVDDARLDAQTALWLQGADSDRLAVERVGRWRKWYLYPVLRALAHWLPSPGKRETRRKLSRIVRASWFRPPFSGERLCNLFFDALEALTASRREGSTLLPPGQRLDVYASLTDLAGHPRTIQLHEGLVAREREHAAYCRLTHATSAAGATVIESDFGDDNLPALVWAARASSSYAGAFPPFRHDELLRVMAARGGEWPGAARFIAENIRVRDGTAAARHFSGDAVLRGRRHREQQAVPRRPGRVESSSGGSAGGSPAALHRAGSCRERRGPPRAGSRLSRHPARGNVRDPAQPADRGRAERDRSAGRSRAG